MRESEINSWLEDMGFNPVQFSELDHDIAHAVDDLYCAQDVYTADELRVALTQLFE
jgi:uncharacterized caspase-like protein